MEGSIDKGNPKHNQISFSWHDYIGYFFHIEPNDFDRPQLDWRAHNQGNYECHCKQIIYLMS